VRSPIRAIPGDIGRWNARLRGLRWLDALVAWLLLASVLWMTAPLDPRQTLLLSLAGVVGAVLVPPARSRWRPVSGPVGLILSRRLRPGDRAWYVRAGEADRVLITARRGLRMVIAKPGESAEGLSVRRTRVLLIPLA
jgi:hypothetical protein